MDFASLMSQAMSKGSPEAESKPSGKYMKRAEQEKQREEAYAEEQRRLEEERAEKAVKKRKLETEEADRSRQREEKRRRLAEESRRRREDEEEEEQRKRRKRIGLPDLPPKEREGSETPVPDGIEDIQPAKLGEKLREIHQPVLLFGETHKQTLKRYRRLTSTTAEEIPENGYTTLELVPEKSMKVEIVPKDKTEHPFLYRQLASYFVMVLKEWDRALAGRPEDVKESHQGRSAHLAMVQSRENMRPLFRKFETGDLVILQSLVEIVKAAQERRYVDANDGYLRLSIGKAAWPIGVTMVGIHERSSREKLNESEAAHIMSDEVTRKFLQSIKRCLSFAQTRWPPTDQRQLMG